MYHRIDSPFSTYKNLQSLCGAKIEGKNTHNATWTSGFIKTTMLTHVLPLLTLAVLTTAQYVSGPFYIHITGKTNSSIDGMSPFTLAPDCLDSEAVLMHHHQVTLGLATLVQLLRAFAMGKLILAHSVLPKNST